MWADTKTSTLNFTAACGGSGTADDGVKWTVTSDGTESNFDSTKGIHYGTGSAQVQYIQLSTSGISGTITKIVVNASTASGVTASVSVKVGGSAFGGNAQSLTTSATDYTFEGSASGEIVVRVEKPSKAAKAIYAKSVTVTYSDGPADTRDATSTIITVPSGFVSDLDGATNVAAGTLTATVVSGEVTLTNPAIEWESTNTDVATVDGTGAVTLKATGKTTIKAKYVGDNDYQPSTGSYELTVVDSKAPGTENNPYTVAQARAAIDAGTGVTGVYVTGIVSKIVTPYNSQYGNITYDISADGTTSSAQLEAYRGKSYNGDNFTSADDIQVGDEVVLYGDLDYISNTYELKSNNQLVSLNRPISTTPVINASDVTMNYDATSGEIEYTITNPADGVSLNATTEADWISNIEVFEDKVTFTTTANEGEADRTATITLSYTGAENKVVTVTQEHYVVDYATLPFAFDGGRSAIENTVGLTQAGLGTDYNSSPFLKFDGTDDYVVLHFNERPGILTFDIKGNGFSGGTFTVQTSVDGETYTSLKSYTELGSTQSEEFNNLGENVRYIKWIYTSKVNGNVALGNIALAQYEDVPAVPSITVTPTLVEVEAVESYGTITVTYNNITDVAAAEVYFCDANGDAATYDWVIADIDGENNVGYFINANDGDARTAYMKVHALDDEANDVYSDLITITQAAYVAPAVGEKYELYSGKLVEGDYIIYYDGYAMKNTDESSRLTYDVVTPENNVITTSNAAIVWHIAPSGEYWTIYNEEADAYAASTGTKNKAQMLGDDTDDKALWTVSGTTAYEFINKANKEAGVNCNLRNNGTYGFACYSDQTGGALSLYKKLAAKLNSEGYATFSSTLPIDYSQATEFTAWIVSEISGTTIKFQQVTGAVAAGTGVLLKGEAGETVYPVAAAEGTTLSDNLLEGITSATEVNSGEYYGLSGNKFVSVNAGTVPAGKALLPAVQVSGARELTFSFEGETTGISASLNDKAEMANEKFYNLAGQRVAQPTKGLYIMNGKKVMFK